MQDGLVVASGQVVLVVVGVAIGLDGLRELAGVGAPGSALVHVPHGITLGIAHPYVILEN
jgi:hypothetical protein